MRALRRTRHRAGCAVPPLPENTAAHAPWASATQMPHSRRRGRWFPRAPPAPSSRQCANAALTGSGNISLPHIPRAPCRGNISTPCVPEERVVAIFRRDASPGCRPWQYFAVVRFRAAIRGKISLWCVFGRSPMAKCSRNAFPRRPTVARSRRDAFPGGDPWRLFHFMRSRGGLGWEKRPFLATYRRHASETGWLWQDICAVHPKSPANGRSGMHRAKILPGRGPFRCAGPSNHARRADLAVVRRLDEKESGKAKKLPAF